MCFLKETEGGEEEEEEEEEVPLREPVPGGEQGP